MQINTQNTYLSTSQHTTQHNTNTPKDKIKKGGEES